MQRVKDCGRKNETPKRSIIRLLSLLSPLADHFIRYLFLVADRRIATCPAPGTAFAKAAAIPGVVVWARTVPGVALDGLLDNLLLLQDWHQALAPWRWRQIRCSTGPVTVCVSKPILSGSLMDTTGSTT